MLTAADNKGFVVTTKKVKLSHKPSLHDGRHRQEPPQGTSLGWEKNIHLNLSLDKGELEQAVVQRRPDQGSHEKSSCYRQVKNFDGRK